ncbi:hypothetical protein ACFZAU_20485 [Streptomyces sp. NPDC008238]
MPAASREPLPPPAAVVPSRPRDGRPRDGRRRSGSPWWFAVPATVLFAFVVLVPSARGVYYAFTDWDGLAPDFSFIGFDNFTGLLDDPDAVRASGTRC